MDLNPIYSISTVIREMQAKAKKKQYFILARMVLIKKKREREREITVVHGDEEIGILIHNWWECKSVQLLWEAVWQFLKKLNIGLLCDSAVLLLGICLREL